MKVSTDYWKQDVWEAEPFLEFEGEHDYVVVSILDSRQVPLDGRKNVLYKRMGETKSYELASETQIAYYKLKGGKI